MLQSSWLLSLVAESIHGAAGAVTDVGLWLGSAGVKELEWVSGSKCSTRGYL